MSENSGNAAAAIVNEMESKAPEVSEHIEDIQDQFSDGDEDREEMPNYQDEIKEDFGKNPPPIPDNSGGAFNPDIHAVDDDGKPIMSKTRPGEYQRKRGRPSKARPAVIPVEDLIRKSARQCTAGIISISVVAFGMEWMPQSDPSTGADERAILTAAFEEYFRTGNMINVPPWMGLAIALFSYAGPRLALPQTQKRLMDFKDKILKATKKKPA